jgi:hypothetical protein
MYNGYVRSEVLEKGFDEALYGVFGGESERSEYVSRILGEIGPGIIAGVIVCDQVVLGRIAIDRSRDRDAGFWRLQGRERKFRGVAAWNLAEKALREKSIEVEHF